MKNKKICYLSANELRVLEKERGKEKEEKFKLFKPKPLGSSILNPVNIFEPRQEVEVKISNRCCCVIM